MVNATKVTIECEYDVTCDLSNSVIYNDLECPPTQVLRLYISNVNISRQISQNGAFYIVQLQIIHSLNFLWNVPLTSGSLGNS